MARPLDVCYPGPVMSIESVIVEVRAAEGGADAKLLVCEQLAIYGGLAGQRHL